MDEKIKIIIVILIVLIPTIHFVMPTVLNIMEHEVFYETIKNVSDTENKSDQSINQIMQSNTKNFTQIKNTVDNSRCEDTIIEQLKDLNDTIENETLKEYINIEITRMEHEKQYWSSMSDEIQLMQEFEDEKTSPQEILQKLTDYEIKINQSETQINEDKEKSYEFLQEHPHIAQRFKRLKIDDDYMIKSPQL